MINGLGCRKSTISLASPFTINPLSSAGIGKKPEGANFYPHDMTKEELDKSDVQDKMGQYSVIRRDSHASSEVTIEFTYHRRLFLNSTDKIKSPLLSFC